MYDTDELVALLESAGFLEVAARSLLAGGYALLTARSPGPRVPDH
jgi:hypothetical protein